MPRLALLAAALFACCAHAAPKETRIPAPALEAAAQLRERALADATAWQVTESLTTEIGPRLAGSEADARAVAWAQAKFRELGFDKVWTEPVTFPKWERRAESAQVLGPHAQPLAVTMNGGACLIVDVDPTRLQRRVATRYLDEIADDLDDAVEKAVRAREQRRAYSVGVVGNAATVLPELLRRGVPADIVTDQTSAHDPLSYVPEGVAVEDARAFAAAEPEEYTRRARASMARHVEAMVGFLDAGAEVFDYGNSIRSEAALGGYERAFAFPGFVPAYIRPLFCEGKGPFRWVALSGDPADIAATDRAVLELFPENESLTRWLRLAGEKVAFQGLPARICWLGYGERDRAGLRFNEMVASGELKAPIVIGRDHLDCGSVASPYRETEGMLDGSDAIADWPLLNALVNTASGASWVSIHHGGGVGIGRSIHAGQVSVADGTPLAAQKLERVLTNDPGMGVIRHVDAGYEAAERVAREHGVRIPMREG